VLLGGNDLTVGGNNLNTTFQGVISGTGSLIKIGRGKLILGNANTYSRGTTIERGKLVVKNVSGSATGSGPVTVNDGILAGTGIVAGTVTVGTGAGSGALLSPGTKGIGSLTIQRALTLNSDAIYNWGLSSNRVAADEVVANGVTISGAQFSYADVGNSVLPPGTVLTAVDNTAATAISGTFSNLADGGTVVIGSNTFQANYEGGDGDDLTLTVVP
jgi:autotransporter-associated beta strand protein